jgi:hypothetical protein
MENTAIMMTAALVTTPALVEMPLVTASCGFNNSATGLEPGGYAARPGPSDPPAGRGRRP